MNSPLPKERFSTDLIDRLVYAHDASLYRLVPNAVARPKNESEVIQLLHYANSTGIPLTFRTGGTSLSGQAVTDGVIVEVVRDWQDYEIHDNGSSISLEPGLTGEFVNTVLRKYQRRLGPDPASIKAARIGGIFSNNASGMCCGVMQNSYHTVKTVRFILANGQTYDTSSPSDYVRFESDEKALCDGLKAIRQQIQDSTDLAQKIRDKYQRKNTLGYGLNSFIDFDHPLDMFSHLLVGAEGTLGFVSRVTYKTIPDPGKKACGLLIFDSIAHACRMLSGLTEIGADAIELMDYASLTTAKYLSNPPYDVEALKPGCAALLVEFQRTHQSELKEAIRKTEILLGTETDLLNGFQTDELQRQKLWQIRKALYPTVGSLRKKGTSVITEDICFKVDQLPNAVTELQSLFKKWQYNDAVVFGHAKDGNLHFVASIDLETEEGIASYEGFMADLVAMTINGYEGALKAEHGTGRNMAPFVATEWGGILAEFMWEIKKLSDPKLILNPDVILTKKDALHVTSLKPMPHVHDTIDLCIECGFCEPVCPSRELTFTPRQRIALLREMKLSQITNDGKLDEIKKSNWYYKVSDTCAVDGLCETACPVNIDTGHYIKYLREERHSRVGHILANWASKHFSFTQSTIRNAVSFSHFAGKIVSHSTLSAMTKILRTILPVSFPQWSKDIPKSIPATFTVQPSSSESKYIYFPSCISRVFAMENGSSTAELVLEIATLTHTQLKIPQDIDSLCCGTPFQSKGYGSASRSILEKTIEYLFTETESGKIPIVVDTSPCSFQFLQGSTDVSEKIQRKWQALNFVDIIPFLSELIHGTEKSPIHETVVLHATCSTRKMNDVEHMVNLAKQCATQVILPDQFECCGFAGDRGLLIPELTASAAGMENRIIPAVNGAIGYSSSRMCEVGMGRDSETDYHSIVLLVHKYLTA